MDPLLLVQTIAAGAAEAEQSIGLGKDAGRALALGLGTGLGAIGPGIGVGYIFGKLIEGVSRQPEMKGELTGIMWLGLALTEAIVFYALAMALVAFFVA